MTPFEDLSLLRAYVRIVESGSISAAARTLKVPQPTLSRYLRALEESCGTALLQRDTHRMSITDAGQRVLEDARGILSLADEAAQRLQENQTILRGHLRLFATIDGGQFTVTRSIARFLKAHPDVTAELGYTNRPHHMIQDGYDVGIVTGAVTDESVVARPAGIVARFLVAAPELIKKHGQPKEPADLKNWPWLALTGSQFGGSESVKLSAAKRADQTIKISPVLTAEGVTSLREAARLATGVTVLPEWLAREDLAAKRLVRVLPQWSARPFPVNVIYPRQRNLPARVRAFVEFAVNHLPLEISGDV